MSHDDIGPALSSLSLDSADTDQSHTRPAASISPLPSPSHGHKAMQAKQGKRGRAGQPGGGIVSPLALLEPTAEHAVYHEGSIENADKGSRVDLVSLALPAQSRAAVSQ